jgi:hypothetical protein
MYALINLFIYILQRPNAHTVQSDLTLLDIGAAHFSRLEFATESECSFPFARDLVSLARDVVAKAKAAAPHILPQLVDHSNSTTCLAGQAFGTELVTDISHLAAGNVAFETGISLENVR